MLRAAIAALLVAGAATVTAQAPVQQQVVGTMSELMVQMIYPTSDAIFYITTRTPKTDQEWLELQAKTLTLAESANLLMMPSRARGREQWLKDSKLMLDVGVAAFKAAKAKDLAALEGLSDQLYESCTTCHQHFRPGYGKPKPPPRY
jgi:cytochrome c556